MMRWLTCVLASSHLISESLVSLLALSPSPYLSFCLSHKNLNLHNIKTQKHKTENDHKLWFVLF